MSRVIVLGLDGACWPLLDAWIQAGDLPNLAALRAQAVWGPLLSELPPVTSPNWRCYATGCNPAKLGVFWWEIVNRERKTIRHPVSHDYVGRPLWTEIAAAGKRVAVLNFPSGYPPPVIPGGHFTAGGPGAKDSDFSYPQEWESELRSKFGYRVHPASILSTTSEVEKALDEILVTIQSRFDVAFDCLTKEVDFLHVTIFYINVLQHFFHRGDPTKKGWQLIDENLGRLMKLVLDKRYSLFLMSDHGCAPTDTVFYINTWLHQQGYLDLNVPLVSRTLSQLGMSRQRLGNLARTLRISTLLRRVVSESILQRLPNTRGTYQKDAKASFIQWEKSRAVASGQGPIYLLVGPEETRYGQLRGELRDRLMKLRHPETGRPIIQKVLFREEIYNGPFLEDAPDLILEQAPGVHTSGSVGNPAIFEPPAKWAAENTLEGLFLAWGSEITAPGTIAGAKIVDLAPTILHLLGVPIPAEVDGGVLRELFASRSEASRRILFFSTSPQAARDPESTEDDEELAERLRALGYLD